MAPFKDDQIFIIAPGSQTTLAQLGLPESFTPARYRLRSRMFQAEKDGEYEPVKIRRREKSLKQAQPEQTNGEAAAPATATAPTTASDGEVSAAKAENGTTQEEEPEWEEDRVSEDGAIWPIQSGRIVDWPCFYALMSHVFNIVNPPFHTPILLIAQPVWTPKDYEKVTQFFFEKFKTPAFTIMDAAMAASYAYGIPTTTVVDVGLNKADVTCIADFILHETGRGLAVPDCGGEAMTGRLVELLSSKKGFNRDVCEQLKRSPICEILSSNVEMPTSDGGADEAPANPAAAASTGIDEKSSSATAVGDVPRGPGPGTKVGEESKLEDEEGVLDIASIVTGGNMTEYLAQKEREKAEKATAKQQLKKGSDAAQQAAARTGRMANSKRVRSSFMYEDFALHDALKKAGTSSQGMADMQAALDDSKAGEPSSEGAADGTSGQDGNGATDSTPSGAFRREIEVGVERFQAVSGGILERLADAIHRAIQSCPDINKRGDLWDNMIVLGNGSKIRGFKEALLTLLSDKYLISPSSATIFTSELPSNLSTPMATGANTPQPQLLGQQGQQPHHPSGVNPLLIAATTAQNPHFNPAGSIYGQQPNLHHSSHTSHAQTPIAIKLAKIPDYFPEWKEVGYDEAAFLGAQVAAKVLFIVDGQNNGYMTRTHYNEVGPGGIHEVSL